MRQIRFFLGALLTFLLVINATFLRKTVAVLLCGVMGFNPISSYYLLHDYGKAEAAVPSSNNTPSIFHPKSYRNVVVEGDVLKNAAGQSLKIKRFLKLLVDNNGKAVYSAETADGKGFVAHEREVLWTQGQSFNGFIPNRSSGYQISPQGNVEQSFSNESSIYDKYHEILLHDGKVVFDSQTVPHYGGGYLVSTVDDLEFIYRIGDDTYVMKNGGGASLVSSSYKAVFAKEPNLYMDIPALRSSPYVRPDYPIYSFNGKYAAFSAVEKRTNRYLLVVVNGEEEEQVTPPCSNFQTMLFQAKDIEKLADTLKKDDRAYIDAVVDIILMGYSSPYAVYMLDVPSEEILDYFKDEQQINAVRSQIIARISKKAENRKRFADIGINSKFMPQSAIYSKENIELFCTLDASKFTKEFWDSLWMAGYIDYAFYKEVEEQLIINSYENYFDILVQIASLIPQTRVLSRYLYRFKGKEYIFTKPQLDAVKVLESKTLPGVKISTPTTIKPSQLPPEAITTIELIEKGGTFPYKRDGIEFFNREGLLPTKPTGYYKEFTVETPGASNRGLRRIITGQNGEMYYTNDHYQKFIQIKP